jgi:hypothetical protein
MICHDPSCPLATPPFDEDTLLPKGKYSLGDVETVIHHMMSHYPDEPDPAK